MLARAFFAQFQWAHTGCIHVKAKLLFSLIYQTKRCANIITERIYVADEVFVGVYVAVCIVNSVVSPGVINIAGNKITICVEYTRNVALQVFLEVITHTVMFVADRNLNKTRLGAVFFMLYGKFDLVVFVYNIARLYHKSLKNTASRLPYIISYQ